MRLFTYKTYEESSKYNPTGSYYGCTATPQEIICTKCRKKFYTHDEDVIENIATQCDCPWCHPNSEHCFHITEKGLSRYNKNKYWMEAMCCICGQEISGYDKSEYPFDLNHQHMKEIFKWYGLKQDKKEWWK